MQHYSRNDARRRADQINDHDQPDTAGHIKHVLNTGLPPGITPEEAVDPGTNAKENTGESGPADDRS